MKLAVNVGVDVVAAFAALISQIPQISGVVIIGVDSIVKFRRYSSSDRGKGECSNRSGSDFQKYYSAIFVVPPLSNLPQCYKTGQRLMFGECLDILRTSWDLSLPRSASFGSQFKISLGVQFKLDVSSVSRSVGRSIHNAVIPPDAN